METIFFFTLQYILGRFEPQVKIASPPLPPQSYLRRLGNYILAPFAIYLRALRTVGENSIGLLLIPLPLPPRSFLRPLLLCSFFLTGSRTESREKDN